MISGGSADPISRTAASGRRGHRCELCSGHMASGRLHRLVGRVAPVIGGRATTSLSAAGLTVALAACGASAQRTSAGSSQPAAPGQAATVSSTAAPSAAGPPCGRLAAQTLAKTVGQVAMRIYAQELASSAVSADRRQVEQYTQLLSALASRNRAAVKEAVTGLVYSHTHVVRLRVTQHGAVLGDVGGPYILAPVGGTLRFHGRSVGNYLLSVQDDLGYVKLETRFIGVPLVLYAGSHRIPLEGTLPTGSGTLPEHGPVSHQGANYEVFSFTAEAFPRGPLRISLLVPLPASLSAESCAQIKISELGRIAEHIWARFTLARAPLSAHINAIRSLTGGLTYVRLGSHQVAGSTQPGPPRLPDHGTVRYRGVPYAVSSFLAGAAPGQVRVYLLVAS
jgi:hypothetical protein